MAKANTVTMTELDIDLAETRIVKRRLNQALRALVVHEKGIMKRRKLLKEERRDESATRRARKKGAPNPNIITGPLSALP